MGTDNKSNLVIIYTVDSGQIRLPVTAEDIYTNGTIDRKKVITLAASNEVDNNRSILNPVVVDLDKNIIL
ncbi:hypothetical protein B9T31_09595 [Acinetobacter sp. ANC 4558]|uniref:hypothetical protein n=1 Tax=Acinetobacter sp. ANC 4558 TaxID=1977876 RepID=UPI000A3386A4|nr:hypothetical protein [Acinetobacter sp. ANC 4558]OTG85838.1 hypothetical protein B9T31_09595 [Acinetobacter sp. ANC 4558]